MAREGPLIDAGGGVLLCGNNVRGSGGWIISHPFPVNLSCVLVWWVPVGSHPTISHMKGLNTLDLCEAKQLESDLDRNFPR